MLTQETKRKIDSARDILVGKVPDPKAQVEQITTAMIYKFMDDMDKDAIELGGKARFFTNGFEKYAWSKLLDSKLGGHERLELYAEAIVQMSSNPHIPQLFRDIFKDAFLPYRNPETLSLFLKEINSFTYDHSEDLGDAFEYLLSIMGSQGDAGQFRTPRHIIDFIVAVVDPKKDDSILDPACGTAGFLISAYKHILKQHDGRDDPKHKEKPLTPDDKKRLMNNLSGYDISPDMVKLSKVNMYLHGFAEPKIYEYDTLSSDEKWDETYDVIMANPPFMTPKGGIRPHKRFSVQANRAEVLFVDYIKEHLRPNGRAGIIVPEGIIFKNDSAYKHLRKLLVEDGLFAVASLPSGVFNPYSGVKTSILFFDNLLAKKVKHILFVKLHSDGFDLGAQRRPVLGDDLPMAVEALTEYRKFITSGGNPDETGWPGIAAVDTNPLCQFVSKEEIAEDDNYNLSSERYNHTEIKSSKQWPIFNLGEICVFEYGKPLKQENRKQGEYPVYGSNGVVGYHNEYLVKGPFIIVGRKGTAGAVVYSKKNGFPIDTAFYIRILDEKKVVPRYLYYKLQTLGLNKVNTQAGVPGLNRNDAYKIKISLPPIEVQKEIVEQIDGYQEIIDLALEMTQVKGINISIDQTWQKVSLNDLSTIRYGYTTSAKDEGDARFVRITDINEYGELNPDSKKFIDLDEESKKYLIKKGDILVARTGATFGKTMIFTEDYPAVFASYLIRLQFDESKILPEYYWCFAQTKEYWDQAKSLVTGGGQPQFNGNVLKDIYVPLPSLDKQKSIADEFLKIRKQLINQNLELIEIFKRKISEVIENI
jgi:type I restriction enzyme M protein